MRIDILAVLASALTCAWLSTAEADRSPRKLMTNLPEENCPTNTEPCLIDLSQPYERVDLGTDEVKEMLEMAENDDNVHAFIALECGKVVAEYYDAKAKKEDPLHLFSITKAFSSLLYGIMEKEVSGYADHILRIFKRFRPEFLSFTII